MKGASCVVYASRAMRRCGYTTVTDWQGGLYASHCSGGSRAGAMMAQTWATLTHLGKDRYDRDAIAIHNTWKKARDAVAAIDGLEIMGKPTACVIAFTSKRFDIYKVADEMKAIGGWEVVRVQRPVGLHLCVSARTPDMIDSWLETLTAAVTKCRDTPAQVTEGMAGIYGQVGAIVCVYSVLQNTDIIFICLCYQTLTCFLLPLVPYITQPYQASIVPDRSIVNEILETYLDTLLMTSNDKPKGAKKAKAAVVVEEKNDEEKKAQ
jgi:hypothetical protein